MKFGNNIWILGIIGMVACGSSNHVQVLAPGVVSSSVEVSSLERQKILAQRTMSFEVVSFSGSELGLEAIELGVNSMKAIVTDAADLEQINLNALTTLASCRFKKSETGYSISELVVAQNKLFAKQFLLMDLHLIHPKLNLVEIQELDQASIYGLLIKGFERLAQKQNVSVDELLKPLCSDVKYDGIFNGMDEQGSLQTRFSWYDDQLLKSRYADAIYDYASEELEAFGQLPIGALVNEISLSAQPGIYSSSTINYSFDL